MTQAKMNGWMQWVVAVLLVVLAIGQVQVWLADDDQPAPVILIDTEGIVANVTAAITDVIDSQDDNAKLDRVCELTNGCEYYEISNSEAADVRDWVENEDKDFVEAFADLVGIDKDYLQIKNIDREDTQVRAYTDDDKDDENYEVQVFYKIKYRDVDEDDYDYAYFVVKSTLDEGEFDEDDATLTEVGRSFEFD